MNIRNFLPPGFPKIVCLCGSTRFGEAFRKHQYEETMKGNIVLTIGSNKSDIELFGNLPQPEFDSIKKKLDELHLRKIDLADEVLVLNVNGYIGESTRKEINYALRNHKTIRLIEPEVQQ